MSYGNKEVIGLTYDLKVGSGGVTKGAAVTLDSSGDAILATAITDTCVGVALQTKSQNDTVTVQASGIAKMVANGTVTIGEDVMVKASGAGAVATAAGATAKSLGVALTTSATGGQVMVLLDVPSVKRPPNA